jgi:hypothetical protein
MNYFMDPEAADREKARREEAHKRLVERERDDLKFVLSWPEGRRLIWRILSEAGVFRSSFTGGGKRTFFNEGKRDLGLMILIDLMATDPEVFARMQHEAAAESKKEETRK